MIKLLLIASAIAWGLWWCAGLYQGPVARESVDYQVGAAGALQKTTVYSDQPQRTYRRAVQTPREAGSWLIRTRRQRFTWPWWAVGLGPLAIAGLYAARQP